MNKCTCNIWHEIEDGKIKFHLLIESTELNLYGNITNIEIKYVGINKGEIANIVINYRELNIYLWFSKSLQILQYKYILEI